MDRSRFMKELEELLQSIPMEERESALLFYNDYFDEAGEENEQEVIQEFESPQKVADKIKADIYRERRQKSSTVEYEVFDKVEKTEKGPWSNRIVKALLIAAIIVGIPVLFPIVAGIVCAVIGCLIAVAAVFFALVVVAFAVTIVGFIVFVSGGIALIGDFAVGLALLGAGLILSSVGAVVTVASVRLCLIVFPGLIREIVGICRKPFQRKVVGR